MERAEGEALRIEREAEAEGLAQEQVSLERGPTLGVS